jgi:hypothetical protein
MEKNMNVLLTVWFAFFIIANLFNASKGKQQLTITPSYYMGLAILEAILLVSIWIWR